MSFTTVNTPVFSSVILVWFFATSQPSTMCLIILMMLAAVFVAHASDANGQFGAMFENPMPATFLIDGKFTLQLCVSIKPVEDAAIRRRTVSANGQGSNREEISSNVDERFSLKLEGHEAIVRTEVANKSRFANESRVKTTTTLPENRSSRLSTSTSRYPTSKISEEEDDRPWESRKTKGVAVKGSTQQVFSRTTSTPSSRPRFSRMRTTTTTSRSLKNSRQNRFVVEQRHGHSPNKSKVAGQNRMKDCTATVKDTMFKLQGTNEDADVIDSGIAASRDLKTEQVQTEGTRNIADSINSKQEGYFNKEPQAEAPNFKHYSVAGCDSDVEQAAPRTEIVDTQTPTVAVKLPVSLKRKRPEESEDDFHGLSNNQETTTRVTITAGKVHPANVTDDSVLSGSSSSVNEDQAEEIPKFNEPLFRHSVDGRVFPGKSSPPVGDATTSLANVFPTPTTIVTSNIAMSLNHRNPIANEPEDFDRIMTEPTKNRLPITEMLTMQVVEEQATVIQEPTSTSEDPNNSWWKEIGDLAVQMNPNAKEVVNTKSQTRSGAHFRMTTSHVPISLRSGESQEFPWHRMGDFEFQMDPRTRQVVNIRTRIVSDDHMEKPTHISPATSSEQPGQNSKEPQGFHRHPSFTPYPGEVQSKTEMLNNQAEIVTDFSVQTATHYNPIALPYEESEEDVTKQEGGDETQPSQEFMGVTNVRMQITTSTPYPTSTNEKKTGSSVDNPTVGRTHIDMAAAKLTMPINRRAPFVKESDELEENSSSIEVENEAQKKQIVRSRERVRYRDSTVQGGRPSRSDYKEHGEVLLHYVDEEDEYPLEDERIAVNPLNRKKMKAVIVNRNRDERGTGGQSRRGDSHPEKESPYFYYRYDTSNALATGSCYLLLLIAPTLLLFCCQ